MGAKAASPIDAHVGRRLRMRREQLRLSQAKLGELLRISYQQIQKYEAGSSRMTAGRLYAVAQELGVSVGFFFAGLPEAGSDDIHDVAMTSEERELLVAFRSIERGLREPLLALAQATRSRR